MSGNKARSDDAESISGSRSLQVNGHIVVMDLYESD